MGLQAQRSDELNITKDEELEVLEWDDGDGWCKGKNKSGQEGYFPQSYVQSISRSSSPMNGVDTTTTSQHPVMTIGSSNTVSSLTSESLSVTPAHSSVQVNGIGEDCKESYHVYVRMSVTVQRSIGNMHACHSWQHANSKQERLDPPKHSSV